MAPKVLLIVDLQKGFVTESSRAVVRPLEVLQNDFEHVVLTRFYNPDPSAFRRILHYYKLPAGSSDAGLAIRPRKDAFIIDRPYYTAVTPALLEYLKANLVTDIHVAGIATEACILKTVLDLFEADICPWVIEDMCASDKDRLYHNMAIELLSKLIGADHIINSSTIGRSRTYRHSA